MRFFVLTVASLHPILADMEAEQAHTIPILYQDHHLLIVNKPAGLVIHPTYKYANGTMWDALLVRLEHQGGDDWRPPELPDEPGWERAPEHIRLMLRERRIAKLWQEEGLLARPTLLHRLDKDTSGVVALARTGRACRHIVAQFHAHTIEKTYLAVARRDSPAWTQPRAPFAATLSHPHGDVEQPSWPLDLARYQDVPLLLEGSLRRDPDDRRRCIVGPGGQEAGTWVTMLATQGEFVLVEARPVTGRTHQIRAHLAAAGYALVGDATYACPAEPGTPAAALTRQFLHALSLGLRDYPTNCPRIFVAPLPSELLAWLTAYFPDARTIINARLAELTSFNETSLSHQS